jgi:hypothetical protein
MSIACMLWGVAIYQYPLDLQPELKPLNRDIKAFYDATRV